ncbi:signal transduction histidine kinase [Runella defluvii]|uniref:Oxygen sensor histidine kinase NreB n=1 Tax=Runella defluvii TaxID=370973 RepID=A0A7W5ZFC3_9BACT|nr:tetratricopeptide repeat protein [Runella defluvii]MBB3836196.1 signal transduction histidine kinase [Runella defluvii]
MRCWRYIGIMLWALGTVVCAQNKMVDSLRHWLDTHPALDSARVVTLHRLSYRLSEIDQAAAWRYANEANQLAKQLNNQVNLGQSFINYAILESLEGNYAKGQEYYLKALRLFEQSGWERGQAICLNNIAENYKSMNQLPKALEYTFKALELNQKQEKPEKRGMAVNHEQIGDLYRRMGRYEESLKYLQKGLVLAKDADQNYQILPQILLGIGRNYNHRREFSTALDYLNQAIERSQIHGEKLLQIQCYQEIAQTYRLQQNFEEAKQYLEKAFETAQEFGSLVETAKLNKELADLEELQGNYRDALTYFQKYKVLNDSIEQKKNVVRAELVELKYNAFEKDKENQRLKQIKAAQEAELHQKTALIVALALIVVLLMGFIGFAFYQNRLKQIRDAQKVQAETIRQMQLSDKIRTQIARDLHDDLGATLSGVAMLSQAAKRQVRETDSQLRELLDLISVNSQRTVATIRDIIWTTRPMNDSLESMLNKMKIFASEMLDPKGIKYEFCVANDLEEYKLPSNQQYNFYLIFKEAINNVAKYAQARHVWVQVFKENDRLHLRIKDDGVGFDKEAVRGSGNGLFNMEKRVEELDGNLLVRSVIDEGTVIALTLPLAA